MRELIDKQNRNRLIPIIAEVERNVDDCKMIRCSYFSVQSVEPTGNWDLVEFGFTTPIVFFNLEAIILGAPEKQDVFEDMTDIDSMYDYVESRDELFVDVNDLWIPKEWFEGMEIKSGLVFRIPLEQFLYCWKYRNDRITIKELLDEGSPVKERGVDDEKVSGIITSPSESKAFKSWTEQQINESKELHAKNKEKGITLRRII